MAPPVLLRQADTPSLSGSVTVQRTAPQLSAIWPARWSSAPSLPWSISMNPTIGNGAGAPGPPPSTSPMPVWTRRTSPPGPPEPSCPVPASASSRRGQWLRVNRAPRPGLPRCWS
ncbi:hypothetical protein D1007_08646 [Hordeum vulgare]|nr:hypothetical protein D1007_08646 [Hordeum vulgare]